MSAIAKLVKVGFDPQHVAQVAQKGGATVAFSSGVMGWLAENHQAIASLGVFAGILIGLIGLGANIYYQHQRSKKGGGA